MIFRFIIIEWMLYNHNTELILYINRQISSKTELQIADKVALLNENVHNPQNGLCILLFAAYYESTSFSHDSGAEWRISE